ncbi:hypothetical protein EYF80_002623 [Liparis tanakae]|uniref:Uncharacterized protein n=1 Tax=Liparis tanakae TaxID=230148 RepID=A0A4Z2JB46_9TELE|nr:hypothetical protein EYF80_002623 [Liparis tanakae]
MEEAGKRKKETVYISASVFEREKKRRRDRVGRQPTQVTNAEWFRDDARSLTLLSLLVPLLHGHQCGEVSLIVGQDQRGAVAAAGSHLQRQVEPSERDGSKRWNTTCSVSALLILHVSSKISAGCSRPTFSSRVPEHRVSHHHDRPA